MIDRLREQTRHHYERLTQMAGEPIVYRSGAAAIAIVAIRARGEFDTQTAEGTFLRVETIDWIVEARLLVLNGQEITPTKAHWIEARGERYQLMDTPVGREFSECGTTSEYLRLHTKKTS